MVSEIEEEMEKILEVASVNPNKEVNKTSCQVRRRNKSVCVHLHVHMQMCWRY